MFALPSVFTLLPLSSSAVFAADSSGDGGFPEEARRVLRGSEAVSEERVHSERLLSVSLHVLTPAAARLQHNNNLNYS